MFSRTATFVAGIALASSLVFAQGFTGTITGTVKDESGAVLQGAVVTARHTETGLTRSAVTDAGGGYRQRDLSVSQERIGNVLVAQGDGAGALSAYRAGLAIRDALAARDPANTQWQTDLAVSCAKLGTLEHGQSMELRHGHLVRGRQVLVSLKSVGRLMPSQDWIPWFDNQLSNLTADH